MKWFYIQLILCGFLVSSEELPVISPGNVNKIFLDPGGNMPRDLRQLIISHLTITSKNVFQLWAGLSYASAFGAIQKKVFQNKRDEIIQLIPKAIKDNDFDYKKIEPNLVLPCMRSCLRNYLRLHEWTSYAYVQQPVSMTSCLYGDHKQGVSWIVYENGNIQSKDNYGKIYLKERKPQEEIITSFCTSGYQNIVLARNVVIGNYLLKTLQKIHAIEIESPILSTSCTRAGQYYLLTCTGPKNYLFNNATGEINQLALLSSVTAVFLKDNKHLLGLDINKKLTVYDIQTMCSLDNKVIDGEINPRESYVLDLSPYNYSYFILYRKPHGRVIYGNIDDKNMIQSLRIHMTCCSSHVFLPEHQTALLIHNKVSIFDMAKGMSMRNIDMGPTIKEIHSALVYDYPAQEISWIHYTSKQANAYAQLKTIKKDLSSDMSLVLFFAKIFLAKQKQAYMPIWASKEQQAEIELYAKKYGLKILQKVTN